MKNKHSIIRGSNKKRMIQAVTRFTELSTYNIVLYVFDFRYYEALCQMKLSHEGGESAEDVNFYEPGRLCSAEFNAEDDF